MKQPTRGRRRWRMERMENGARPHRGRPAEFTPRPPLLAVNSATTTATHYPQFSWPFSSPRLISWSLVASQRRCPASTNTVSNYSCYCRLSPSQRVYSCHGSITCIPVNTDTSYAHIHPCGASSSSCSTSSHLGCKESISLQQKADRRTNTQANPKIEWGRPLVDL